MSPTRLFLVTALALIAFAANSLLNRAALALLNSEVRTYGRTIEHDDSS